VDFLAACVWIWETLILVILPLISIMLAIIFIMKIFSVRKLTMTNPFKRRR